MGLAIFRVWLSSYGEVSASGSRLGYLENWQLLYLEPEKSVQPQPANNRLSLQTPIIGVAEIADPQNLQNLIIKLFNKAEQKKEIQTRLLAAQVKETTRV